MNVFGWILFAACCVASGAVGWGLKTLFVERAEFLAEERRDAEWDERHGIRRGRQVLSSAERPGRIVPLQPIEDGRDG